jgi:hypothetical protein
MSTPWEMQDRMSSGAALPLEVVVEIVLREPEEPYSFVVRRESCTSLCRDSCCCYTLPNSTQVTVVLTLFLVETLKSSGSTKSSKFGALVVLIKRGRDRLGVVVGGM